MATVVHIPTITVTPKIVINEVDGRPKTLVSLWGAVACQSGMSLDMSNEAVWKNLTEEIVEDFRVQVLVQHVFPFLENEENVIDVDEVIFVHDKAPCMEANMTQQLIKDNNIKFWGNNIWPRNSPDPNAAEHIVTIIKDEAEKRMLSETGSDRYSEQTLKNHIIDVLQNMETDTELFENLLCSYPSRLRDVKKANSGHTDY
ncbi:unnamed protein product [Didymodactylos carnosus]|uniref:Uncharacterized protein n=1 Tax=Didymodactylos carnosus TaxID=1234261 RepID=A0A814RN27_9BILA|nr:unnamed protein product [Didymodactylos carnosus]CAF3899669.1 unnamed protein product [Didymodactylos carnosus]